MVDVIVLWMQLANSLVLPISEFENMGKCQTFADIYESNGYIVSCQENRRLTSPFRPLIKADKNTVATNG